MLTLTDNNYSAICKRIADTVQPTKIYLFGSRVTGKHHPESDIDLMVVYDGPKSEKEVDFEIRRALRDRNFSLDLVLTTTYKFNRFKHVANTLAREINEKGLLIYG